MFLAAAMYTFSGIAGDVATRTTGGACMEPKQGNVAEAVSGPKECTALGNPGHNLLSRLSIPKDGASLTVAPRRSADDSTSIMLCGGMYRPKGAVMQTLPHASSQRVQKSTLWNVHM